MTPIQRAVLAFINRYCHDNGGIAPSYREIAAGCGLKSKSGVFRAIHALKDQGRLRHLPRRARTVEPFGAWTEERAFLREAANVARELRRHHQVETTTREAFLAAHAAWESALAGQAEAVAQSDLEDFTGRAAA